MSPSSHERLSDDPMWQEIATPDLIKYFDTAKLSPQERLKCLRNPARYFAFPRNVPVELRKQIYLPKFAVTLFRTPHLPPKYASFDVPLWFNKLDMKDFLKSVYNVDTLHIRSTVLQQKVVRDEPGRKGTENQGRGRLRRPMSKKKMTVELVEPFVWPEEIKDLTAWEQDKFFEGARENIRMQRRMSLDAVLQPDEKHRKSIAEQAKELLEGKAKWKPTWQSISADVRVMQGTSNTPTPPP